MTAGFEAVSSRVSGAEIPGPRLQGLSMLRFYGGGWISMLEACQRRYGDVFRLRLPLLGSVVVLADPRDIRAVLTDHDVTSVQPRGTVSLAALLGDDALPLLDGDAHQRRRNVLLRRLSPGQVAAREHEIVEIIAGSVGRWRRGDVIRLGAAIPALTAEVIARVLFGSCEHAAVERCRTLFPRVVPAWGLAQVLPDGFRSERVPGPWRRFAGLTREVHGFIDDQMRANRARGDDGSLCALLLSAAEELGLSDEQVRTELIALALANSHTIALAASWMFDCVLHDQATRDRLAADPEDVVLHDAVVAETLRLRPPIEGTARELIQDVELGGVPLPAGTVVLASFHLAHRVEHLYARPDEFVPDRFLGRRPPPTAWFPFGAGAHRCLGAALAQLEMRVMLREILGRWGLRPLRSRPSRPRRQALFWAPAGGLAVQVDGAGFRGAR